MEGLTKQQLILVALLVSFVTSIATGIVTVTLVDQAPPGVTQTINRVVERTIERVVQAPNQSASVVTKETVVVKADDLVVAAIDKNGKSIVRIKKVIGVGENRQEEFSAIGLALSKEGVVVTDSSVLSQIADDTGAPVAQSYYAVMPNGTSSGLKVIGTDYATGLVLFSLDSVTASGFLPASLSDSSTVKLGQTVISIGGDERNTAETGIVATLPLSPAQENTPLATTTTSEGSTLKPIDPSFIKTDLRSTDTTLGAILLNLSGDVIGMKVGRASHDRGVYLPANIISGATTKILGAVKKTS